MIIFYLQKIVNNSISKRNSSYSKWNNLPPLPGGIDISIAEVPPLGSPLDVNASK